MNKFEKIEQFLKLISEIKKNGITVDSNLVYSNLINLGTTKESIENYFTSFIERFSKDPKTYVYVSDDYKSFCQFIGKGSKTTGYNKIKIYIPLDIRHIYRGVSEIFDFTSKSNISHKSKVSNTIRFDDVVLRVDSISDAEKIRYFVENNSYIRQGLINTNPFAFTDGNISFCWDGELLYNLVVSNWVSDYINEKDEVSYSDFFNYVYERYLQIFKNGVGINAFAKEKGFVNYERELANYKTITELIIQSLKGAGLKDFYTSYQNIIDVEKDRNLIEKIRKLLRKDEQEEEITPEKKEIFDYIFIELGRKNPESTIRAFKEFSITSNYKLFTRDNNITEMLMQNLSRNVLEKLLKEEEKSILISSSRTTFEKYDSVQLARALFKLKSGDYSGFTNEFNSRDRLRMFVDSSEVDELIHSILLENGYDLDDKDDEIWIYIELIEKMKEKTM